MKINKPIYFFLFLTILFFSCNKRAKTLDESKQSKDESNQLNLSIIDTVSHEKNINSISTVTIDNQIWMTKNLDVNTFRNGDTIFEAKSDEDWKRASKLHIPAWCYYDNNSENGKLYGKLYNWYAVMDERGLAPLGFHIPNNLEYDMLLLKLGLSRYGNQENKHNIASKLKSTSRLWSSIMDRNNETSTNSSGFDALPGGLRYERGSFNQINEEGHWWTSENIWRLSYNQVNSNKSAPSQLSIDYWVLGIGAGSFDAGTGLSVRCIKGEINRTTNIPILQNEFLELDEDGKPRQGEIITTNPAGVIIARKHFKDGIEEGVRINYNNYGEMYSKGNYKNGLQDGEWLYYDNFYHDNISEKGKYIEGKKEGEWIKYIISSSSAFTNIKWIIGRKEIYKNGVLDGELLEYDRDGNLRNKEIYKNGIKIITVDLTKENEYNLSR